MRRFASTFESGSSRRKTAGWRTIALAIRNSDLAYWLAEKAARLQAQRNPRFVTAQHDADLSPIPEIEARPVDGDASNGHHCAIISNQDFVLYSGQTKIGSYELPVYADASGGVKQVAITPIAVAADLTIVGGVLFVWVWSGGGFNSVH